MAAEELKPEPSPPADVTGTAPEEIADSQEAQKDIPQPSIEVRYSPPDSGFIKLTQAQEIAPGQEPTLANDALNGGETAAGEDRRDLDVTDRNTSVQPTPAFGAGFGFDASTAAGIPGGMGFGGDLSQMQMMMAMQNGMTPNAFSNFPMMGM